MANVIYTPKNIDVCSLDMYFGWLDLFWGDWMCSDQESGQSIHIHIHTWLWVINIYQFP